MFKSSLFFNLSKLLTLVMGLMIVSTCFAQSVDLSARGSASAANTAAAKAKADADAAKAKADKAERDAAAAQAKADTGVTNAAAAQVQANTGVTNAAAALARANAVGTNANGKIKDLGRALEDKIRDAKAAADAGNKALEAKINGEIAKIQADIEELKKKAQHECAAFGDVTTQTACLKSLENKAAGAAAVANHALDDVGMALTGCRPTETKTVDGITTTKYTCPENYKPSVVLNSSTVFGKNGGGISDFAFTPVGFEKKPAGYETEDALKAKLGYGAKAAIALGFGLVGGVTGYAAGEGANRSTVTISANGTRSEHSGGGMLGASLGFASGVVVGLIVDYFVDR